MNDTIATKNSSEDKRVSDHVIHIGLRKPSTQSKFLEKNPESSPTSRRQPSLSPNVNPRRRPTIPTKWSSRRKVWDNTTPKVLENSFRAINGRRQIFTDREEKYAHARRRNGSTRRPIAKERRRKRIFFDMDELLT